jgi:hypothetical protein
MATMQNALLLASNHEHGVAACGRSPTDPELHTQQFHSGNEHSLRRKLVVGGWPCMVASRHCQQIFHYHSDIASSGNNERECYSMRNFGTYFTGTYVYLLVLQESLLHKKAV